MTDRNEILQKLNTEDIVNIMSELGSPVYGEGYTSSGEKYLMFQTICHGGDSHKLYFYTESKTFNCFTRCGSLSLYDLISRVNNCEFKDSLNYLARKAGITIGSSREGIQSTMTKENKIVANFLDRKRERRLTRANVTSPEITTFYNENVLNYFDDNTFYQGWIDEGITINTMRKYNISYYYLESYIIIPHYNIDGRLVGIRRRSLKPEDSNNKYMPIILQGEEYDHRLALNLYGLNHTKDAIKKQKKAVLVEGEKSVMMGDSFYGEDNILVGTCGFNVSDWQMRQLQKLGVQNIYLGFDKDFDLSKQDKYTGKDKELLQRYKEKLYKLINRLNVDFKVYLMADKDGLLGPKDSPTDKGKEVFEILMASAERKIVNREISKLC